MEAALTISDSELIAAVIGALLGIVATIGAMHFQRATERKKLTLEVFVQKIWDKDYILCVQRLETFAHLIETATLDQFLKSGADGALGQAVSVTEKAVSSDGASTAEASAVAVNSQPNPFETPRDVFRSLMNFYEIMAIGIRDQILDEMICKRYMYGELMENWRSCKSITEKLRVRNNNDRIYREVENLAKRWARNPPRPESALLTYLRGWY